MKKEILKLFKRECRGKQDIAYYDDVFVILANEYGDNRADEILNKHGSDVDNAINEFLQSLKKGNCQHVWEILSHEEKHCKKCNKIEFFMDI